jgi:hypothetical protein
MCGSIQSGAANLRVTTRTQVRAQSKDALIDLQIALKTILFIHLHFLFILAKNYLDFLHCV